MSHSPGSMIPQRCSSQVAFLGSLIMGLILPVSLRAVDVKPPDQKENQIIDPSTLPAPTARAMADYNAAAKSVDNSIGVTLKLLPPGIAWNHCPAPEEYTGKWGWNVRQHTIPAALYVSAHEITQKQYSLIMGENPSKVKGEDLPVTNLRWHDVAKFCRRLSAKEKQTYRLPNEIEWEYACRGGTKTDFHFGDAISAQDANFDSLNPVKSAAKAGPGRPVKVGSYKANAYGLFDMHGNVAEWCLPSSTASWDGDRYIHGGAYDTPGVGLRAGHLYRQFEHYRHTAATTRDNVGFRIVRELTPKPGAAFGDSTPKRLLERLAKVLDPKRTTSRPSVLVTVSTDSFIVGGHTIAAMAQGALASISKDTPPDKLPRIFPESSTVMRTLATQTGDPDDPLSIKDVQKVLNAEVLVQCHLKRASNNFVLTGTVLGPGFPKQGIPFEQQVALAEFELVPGFIALRALEALKIPVTKSDTELLKQPFLVPPKPKAQSGYAALLPHVADARRFGGLTQGHMKFIYGPRFIPAWGEYLTHPDFRWRAMDDLEALNGPKSGTELAQVRFLILEGRLDEAFEQLMVLGPVFRQTPYWYRRLLECCALYDEEDVIKDVLKRFAAEHPQYAGAISRGEFLTSWAWYARGGGAGAEVNESDWPKFTKRLELAAEELKVAIKDYDADEHARAALIVCSTGLGKPLEETLPIFLEGMQRRPGSFAIANAMLAYLRPRWNGSPELILRFGEACAKGGTWESGVKQLAMEAARDAATQPQSIHLNREVMMSDEFQNILRGIRNSANAPIKDPQKQSASQLIREEALAFSSRWSILAGHPRDAVDGFRQNPNMSYERSKYTLPMIGFMTDITDAVADEGFLTATAKVRVALAVGQLERSESLLQAVRPTTAPQRQQVERLKRALQQAQTLQRDGELTFTADDLHAAWLLSGGNWIVEDGCLLGFPELAGISMIACPFGFGPATITGEFDPEDAALITIDPTARRFGLSYEAVWNAKNDAFTFHRDGGRVPDRAKSFQCVRTTESVAWTWNDVKIGEESLDLSRPAGFAMRTQYQKQVRPLRLKQIQIKLSRDQDSKLESENFADEALEPSRPLLKAPAAAQLETSRKVIIELFADDLKAVKRPGERHAVAIRMLRKSRDTEAPTERYALMTESINSDMLDQNYIAAMSTIDKLAAIYDVDPWSRKISVVKEALKTASPDEKRRLVQFMLRRSHLLVESEEFDLALEELATAVAIATESKDAALSQRIQQQIKTVAACRDRSKAAQSARQTLDIAPEDVQANLTLGQYAVFVTRDWESGLDRLTRAGDHPLAILATLDRRTTGNDDGYLKAANAWSDYAKSQAGLDRQVAFARSVHWFSLATLLMSSEAIEANRGRIALATHGAHGLPTDLLEKPANGLQQPAVTDYAAGEQAVSLGKDFDFTKSWILSVDIKIKNRNGNSYPVLLLGDNVAGHESMSIRHDSTRIFAAVFKYPVMAGSEISTPPAQPLTSDWTNLVLAYDAALGEMRFYVNHRLADAILCAKPQVHRPLPLHLGGDGKNGKFGGQLRNLWFGNSE